MRWEREELGKKTGCVLSADLLPGLATRGLLMREKNAGITVSFFIEIILFQKIYIFPGIRPVTSCLLISENFHF